MRHAATVLILASLGLTTATADSPWPHWRGPSQNGVADGPAPTRWSRTENVLWRTPLPGAAGSTPIVVADRIFLTTLDGQTLRLLCYSTAGEELWTRKLGSGNKNARGDEGNFASPSPVTDGEYVYAFVGTGELAAYSVEGKRRWHVDLQRRFGRFEIQFGMSSSPVVHDGKLLVALLHGDGDPGTREATVAALDTATGETVWAINPVTGAARENEHSYASPMLAETSAGPRLVVHGAEHTLIYDPATGGEVARLAGLNPTGNPTQRFVASPAFGAGTLVVPTAKNGLVTAVDLARLDGRQDLGGDAVLWTMRRNTPDVPSPVVAGEFVYLCRENGNLICLDRTTGRIHYQERTHMMRHRASPLLADGKLYLTARDGRVTVVKAGADFEVLAVNEIDEDVSSSPVLVDGTLYLRSFDALWAIGD
ncbi:MAG: PQQ-binding-like beta-propeller repeat protein [Planctomycetota bacterium]